MKETVSQIMKRVQGLNFKAVGPFLVADLSTQAEQVFENLPVGEHGMEDVLFGQKTQAHTHEFPSFYKSKGLDVEYEGERFILPARALTLVLPGLDHSWVPKQSQGAVGSVDWRHEKQFLVAA
jgi:hypothetical protein